MIRMSSSCRWGSASALAGLGACLLLSGCGSTRTSISDPLPPGLTLEMREEFYGIIASTAEELAEAMRRLGPEVGGDRVPGATNLVSRQFGVRLPQIPQPVKTRVEIGVPSHDAKGGPKIVKRQITHRRDGDSFGFLVDSVR